MSYGCRSKYLRVGNSFHTNIITLFLPDYDKIEKKRKEKIRKEKNEKKTLSCCNIHLSIFICRINIFVFLFFCPAPSHEIFIFIVI